MPPRFTPLIRRFIIRRLPPPFAISASIDCRYADFDAADYAAIIAPPPPLMPYADCH